jgi:hypothetical protein
MTKQTASRTAPNDRAGVTKGTSDGKSAATDESPGADAVAVVAVTEPSPTRPKSSTPKFEMLSARSILSSFSKASKAARPPLILPADPAQLSHLNEPVEEIRKAVLPSVEEIASYAKSQGQGPGSAASAAR